MGYARLFRPENIAGGLLGIYDPTFKCFLPAMKVNFDPFGRQIKTPGQRARLEALVREIIALVPQVIDADGQVVTLYEIFIKEGEHILKRLLGDLWSGDVEQLLAEIPRGQDLWSLVEFFNGHRQLFETPIKKPKAAEKFIQDNLEFFQALTGLDKKGQKRLRDYFSKAKELKAVSAKLVKPQILLGTAKPIILEAQVFDAKWSECPFAAGFHSWYSNSFMLTNCFAERIRYDKSDTTDNGTIHAICRRFSVKKRQRRH